MLCHILWQANSASHAVAQQRSLQMAMPCTVDAEAKPTQPFRQRARRDEDATMLCTVKQSTRTGRQTQNRQGCG